MLSVAVLGHSLVPETITVNDVTDVCFDIYRYPGATVNTLTYKFEQSEFRDKTYDLVII